MSKRFLFVFLAAASTALAASGCSLKIKNELDGKGPAPTDSCETDADCSGEFVVCQLNFNGTDSYRACTCARGYEPDSSGACAWVGVVNAPGFDDAAPWTVRGDVDLNPAQSGNGDPGVVTIGTDGICTGGSVSQTINLSYARDDVPLAVEVLYRTVDGAFPYEVAGVGVGIGRTWSSLPAADAWTSERVCLGPGSTGGDVTLSVAALYRGTECQHADFSLEISRVDIVPAAAGECPPIGGVVNGDFEDAGDWDTFLVNNDASMAIEPMIGAGGSDGLRISTGPGGGYVAARGTAIFPEDGPDGPYALRFWYRGNGPSLAVQAGDIPIAQLPPNPTGTIVTVCAPPMVRGGGQQLVFATSRDVNEWTNDTNWAIDDITMIPRGECEDNGTVLDGSFELASSPLISPPYLPLINGGGYASLGAAAVVDPLTARTGEAAFVLSASNYCDELYDYQPRTWVAGGYLREEIVNPALVFWYLVDDLSQYRVRTTLDGTNGWWPETTPGWQRHRICLPVSNNGKPISYGFVFQAQSGGGCGTPIGTTQRVFIDDVEVIDDASCP